MCYDVFAAWSWLLPLNVSVLTSLTPCEPPLRPLLQGWGELGPGTAPSQEGVGAPRRTRREGSGVGGRGTLRGHGGVWRSLFAGHRYLCFLGSNGLKRSPRKRVPSCVCINVGAVMVLKNPSPNQHLFFPFSFFFSPSLPPAPTTKTKIPPSSPKNLWLAKPKYWVSAIQFLGHIQT